MGPEEPAAASIETWAHVWGLHLHIAEAHPGSHILYCWCERSNEANLTVLEPAIELAEGGFPVAPLTATQWKENAFQLQGPGKGALLNSSGKPPGPGEVVVNADLAATFRKMAEHGARRGFYSGPVAEAVVRAVQGLNGVLDHDDMESHATIEVEPISTTYHGLSVWEVPPPNQGIVALMALNHLEGNASLSGKAWGSVEHIHSAIEAVRLAFFDALQHNADPEVMSMSVDELLDKTFSESRRKECLASAKAARLKADPLPTGPRSGEGSDTVYFAVVDGEGNGCSFINSNYAGFGTGIVPEGCGFPLQNRGHNFILDPAHPNCLGPRKHPYHTLIPGMATLSNGDLYAVFGVMGGFMQPQGHLQVLSNMVDFGMDPQTALDVPRFCIAGVDSSLGPACVSESRVFLEEGFDSKLAEDLAKRGHRVIPGIRGFDRQVFGRGQIIMRRPSGVLWGGSEPRADGTAMGW